jgi:hypothetical protein
MNVFLEKSLYFLLIAGELGWADLNYVLVCVVSGLHSGRRCAILSQLTFYLNFNNGSLVVGESSQWLSP